jgi:hypothetical protein
MTDQDITQIRVLVDTAHEIEMLMHVPLPQDRFWRRSVETTLNKLKESLKPLDT